MQISEDEEPNIEQPIEKKDKKHKKDKKKKKKKVKDEEEAVAMDELTALDDNAIKNLTEQEIDQKLKELEGVGLKDDDPIEDQVDNSTV